MIMAVFDLNIDWQVQAGLGGNRRI